MAETALASAYRFAGLHCGIKESGRLDLAVVLSDRPATVAGVFTQNRVVAAPVHVCRTRVPADDVRGVVICSGNANACTGERGMRDAERMTALLAQQVNCRPEQVLVCSTGVIGVPLPMDCLEKGIRDIAGLTGKSDQHFDDAAKAILTTDTRSKVSTRNLIVEGHNITVTGFAKGAAMIGPNMATMLAFVMTDAAVSADDLSRLATTATQASFNCISVEGHTSTNDTLLLFANGDGQRLTGAGLAEFGNAVTEVCQDLAKEIVADAEGADHLIKIDVRGLRSEDEAKQVARTVADSALVKTAIFGADPNWGRIVSAGGYAGVDFAEEDLSLRLGEFLLYERGVPQDYDAGAASQYMKENRELDVRLDFTLGDGSCVFWTSDLTYEYVRLNAEYTT